MTGRLTLAAGKICRDPDFQFREFDHPALVRNLAGALKRGTQLDPVLIWRERDDAGKPTGRHVLLDGAHRMKAYRSLGRSGAIPVEVFEGTRDDALEAAVAANAKAVVGLTSTERTNAAWRLVRIGTGLTKPRIMKAAGVSSGTVAEMRRRANMMREAGKDASGRWRTDRRDPDPERKAFDPDKAEAARQEEVVKMAEGFRKAAGWCPHVDQWSL
ncbi:ParB N-terminal domain-containing protein, partial [Loktanella sp. TSTF-M6]